MSLRRLLPLVVALILAPAAQASAFERVQQYGVGFPGSGNGQMSSSTGVAVSPSGTVVATDKGAQRVAIFSQSGVFQRAFGRDVSPAGGTGAEVCSTDCKNGSGGVAAGELNEPWGVVAGDSEIFVSEQGNHRISVFNFQGQFLRAFGANVGGAGVNTCTAVCTNGTSGSAAGQMNMPAGLALDAGGNLFVAEQASARIDVFNSQSGQFLRAFGKNVGGAGINTCTTPCAPGAGDGTPGSVNSATGLALAANGELFIAESGINRISVFSTQGQFLRTLGSPGSGAGQLVGPYGVAVDGVGNVYVSELGNNRLSVFGTGGDFRRAYGRDVIPGAPVVAEVCSATCKNGEAGFGVGEFAGPYGVATDCRGAVYVDNASAGRIDKFAEPSTALPPCPPSAAAASGPPSNVFSFGKAIANRKKGTLSVEITVPGPGALAASAGRKIAATAPQPTAAGVVRVTLKASGKGVKSLKKKGKLKGTLSLTFTPSGGGPGTQSKAVQLVKKLKKPKKDKPRSGPKGGGKAS